MADKSLICDITIDGLKSNDIDLYRLKGHEEMGRLFMYEVDLLARKTFTASSMLGKSMIVSVKYIDNEHFERKLTGIVTEFKYYGVTEKANVSQDQYRHYYRAVLRPELWLLTLTSHCRIFKDIKMTEIIEKVLREHGINFESPTSSTEQLEYCVQYRESDFAFISRLMEQEGIYYYFRDPGSEVKVPNSSKLILTSDKNRHKTFAGYEVLNCSNGDIYQVQCNFGMTSSRYTLKDYHFEQNIVTTAQMSGTKSPNKGKVYDYLADYNEKNVGGCLNSYAKIRLEELETDYAMVRGRSTALAMSAGMLFELKDNEINFDIDKCVVSSVDFLIQASPNRSGDIVEIPFENQSGPSGEIDDHFAEFDCCFTAIPADQQFRPRRITPVPSIQGSQTAVVCDGPDKYGRVKVKFHWDENNVDYWVRVSHPMAGKNWGWISLPRVHQEVIVNFEEGNPNRPIITGRVYNGASLPPYELPANKTQSGIKTVTYDGSGFNELRFEDKDGQQQIYLHAEKDLKCEIKENEIRNIDKDKTVEVKGKDSLKVTDTCTIQSDKSIELKVGSNSIKIDQQGITIKGLKVTIEGNATVDVKSAMTTVNGDGKLTLKGAITMIN
jgi:type VI secretion system secreted protein VgrG